MFAAEVGTPLNLAIDSNYLYWMNTTTNYLVKAALDGTGSRIPVARSGNSPVAIDGQNIYWTGASPETATLIFKLGPGDNSPTLLATHSGGVFALAANSSGVYWISSPGAVMKVDGNGGTPVTLANVSLANGIAVDDQYVWVKAPAAILRIGIAGDGATVVGQSTRSITTFAVSSGFVYWVDDATGLLMRLDVAGGQPEPALPYAINPTSFVVDASGLYWTDSRGMVFAGTPGSSDQRIVADSGGLVAYGIVSDAHSVYWIATPLAGGPGGAIMRAPK